MQKGLIFIMVCAMVICLPVVCFCQEKAAPVQTAPAQAAPAQTAPEKAAEETTEYSEGTVVSVNATANEITISEYDWNTDAEASVTYSVDPAAQVENVASWKDLVAGNYIDIEYAIQNGKRIAKYINLYQQKPEEAAAAEKVAPTEETAPEPPAEE